MEFLMNCFLKSRFWVLLLALAILILNGCDNKVSTHTSNSPKKCTSTTPYNSHRLCEKSVSDPNALSEFKPKSINEVSDFVYVTSTGKRYHLASTCGGKNSYRATLKAALNRGLTPCKKCAK